MPPSESKAQSLLLGAVFFASGVVALLYEAAWQRQFTLLFGSAAPATAAVLAAYFAGLGLGSWLLGKWGARWRQPLRTYAVLELVIAAGALLVAPLLSLYATFYPGLYERGAGTAWLLLSAKLLLAFGAIVIPAAAMGGTLPVLAQLFENRRDRLGELAGRLYMLNTAGAACGVLLFPSLLRALGMRQSVWLCASVNLLLAAAAWRMSRSMTAVPAPVAATQPAARGLRLWLALAFGSGFVTFVLQTGWNRIFAQTHGNSVHSFVVITALFIAALAAGAQLARVLLRRRWTPEKGLLFMWGMGGFLTVSAAMMFPRLTDGLNFMDDATVFQWSFFKPALWAILLPVTLLAAGLPLILQKAATLSSRPAGAITGSVLAWNVTGCVAGTLAAGFLLPAPLGMFATVAFAGTVTMLGAALVNRKLRWPLLGLTTFGAVVVGLLAFSIPSRVRLETKKDERLLALKEDAYGVSAVVEVPGSRRLKLNNHYALGGSASTGDERMQAHLPLLLHPQPQRVIFLGYGTGITAGGAVFHAPREITALELVPSVAALAGEFFAEQNRHFATQPSARLIIEDARNFLRGTAEEFDVIVGDLVVPWRQGEGALYTLENFEAARARLASGGLYCAWLPLFQLGEDDFRSILRTFLKVFPQAQVWRGDFSPTEPALALVGGAGAEFNPATVAARLAQMQPDPLNPQLAHATAAWMHCVGMVTREQAGDGPLNTEDCPRVELRTTRPPPFTGRALLTWEQQLPPPPALPPGAAAGRQAGALMREFALLYTEGRQSAAQAVMTQITQLIGPDAARAIFGK